MVFKQYLWNLAAFNKKFIGEMDSVKHFSQRYNLKLSYCFAGWHCWNGVNKTKGIEQSAVQRHGKEVGRGEEGVGEDALTGVESDA